MDYARLAETARRLISQFGIPVVLTTQENPDYDPTTGSVEASEEQIVGVAARGSYSVRDRDGTVIQEGDAKFYMSLPDAATVSNGGQFSFDGEVWQIVNHEPIKPAAIVVAWVVQGRRVN